MITLRITLLYCAAFYFLIMLHASNHELVHHFMGYAICGDWGTKTFNSFSLACDTEPWVWAATYAGPIYTYAMMWLGAAWLARGKTALTRHLGFATIFAQLPLQRMTGPMFGWNDEWYATWHLFGDAEFNRWIVTAILFALTIPPLVRAYLAIENRLRVLWFAFYFVLFPYLVWGPFFGALEYLMVYRGVLDEPVIGIGLLFIINEVVTIAGFALTQRYLDPDDRGRAAAPAPA